MNNNYNIYEKDNEKTINALRCCTNDKTTCRKCPLRKEWGCIDILEKNALDLINRQKAFNCKVAELKTAKAEAIKEFAERLKEKAGIYPYYYKGLISAVSVEKIDNLVKEMVGE